MEFHLINEKFVFYQKRGGGGVEKIKRNRKQVQEDKPLEEEQIKHLKTQPTICIKRLPVTLRNPQWGLLPPPGSSKEL